MLANSTGCTKWLVPIIGIPTQALSITPGDASVTGSRVKVTLIINKNNNYTGAMFYEVPATLSNLLMLILKPVSATAFIA